MSTWPRATTAFLLNVAALALLPGCLQGECGGKTTVRVTNDSTETLTILVQRAAFWEGLCGRGLDPLPTVFEVAPSEIAVVACGSALGYTPRPAELIERLEIQEASGATLRVLDLLSEEPEISGGHTGGCDHLEAEYRVDASTR